MPRAGQIARRNVNYSVQLEPSLTAIKPDATTITWFVHRNGMPPIAAARPPGPPLRPAP